VHKAKSKKRDSIVFFILSKFFSIKSNLSKFSMIKLVFFIKIIMLIIIQFMEVT
jgi:hypothetical protein